MWVEALGLENYLSKDGHFRHLLGLNENGGKQALHAPKGEIGTKVI